jgi:hypothetical protein
MPHPIRSIVILLCGKCAHKLKGGYGANGKESLRTVLRAGLNARGYNRGVRVVETRCLGICPKRALTARNANRSGRILTVPKGASADEALAHLVEAEREPPITVAS